MFQAKTLTQLEIDRLLSCINTHKYAALNRSMMLLTYRAGLRIGDVEGLRWSDATTTDGLVKDEMRRRPDMAKDRHARTVFVSAKLKRNRKPKQRKRHLRAAVTSSLPAKI